MNLSLTFTGQAPGLLVQSARLLDPLDKLTIEHTRLVNEKPAKDRTEADLMNLFRTEFFAALHYRSEIGPFLPSSQVLASLVQGARREAAGKKLQAALLINEPEIPLIYEGPRKVDELWKQERFRFIMPTKNAGRGGMVLRCRARFPAWEIKFTAELDTHEMDLKTLERIASAAGRYAGLGSWRPGTPKGGQYGRYEAVVRSARR